MEFVSEYYIAINTQDLVTYGTTKSLMCREGNAGSESCFIIVIVAK